MTPPRRANYARPPHNQPALEQKIAGVEPLGPKTLIDDETILNRLRMAKFVDESLGQILSTLDRSRKLDDTMVIFTSDNGYFAGEHRVRRGKNRVYEEAIRVPLVIRGPGVPTDSEVDDLSTNADLAPTILDAAGVTPGLPEDGSRQRTPAVSSRAGLIASKDRANASMRARRSTARGPGPGPAEPRGRRHCSRTPGSRSGGVGRGSGGHELVALRAVVFSIPDQIR
jgi:hypothetical protein